MRSAISFALILLFSLLVSAGGIDVYYFYGEGCPHCARALPYVAEITQHYPEVNAHYLEIYKDHSNAQLLYQFFQRYNVPLRNQGVPVAFVGSSYLSGDRPIIENLDSVIKKEISLLPPDKPPSSNVSSAVQHTASNASQANASATVVPVITGNITEIAYGGVSPLEPEGISLFVVTGAALVDSINPCAIAVLLILLGTLILSNDKNRALYSGIAFIASLYIMYFLFGLGVMSIIQFTGLSYLFYQFVGVLALLIGLFNVKDYFWYGGGGFVMEIPRSWRPLLKKFLTSVTSPAGAFLMGFLVVLFELPCTGGPYVFILGLLAEKSTFWPAVPLLLYYNFIFVLPLLFLTILMYFGMAKIEQANEWKDRNIRILHLIAGIIMVILGAAVLLRIV